MSGPGHVSGRFTLYQTYFQGKTQSDLTEIRVLDTYWSDHCRHTTFLTELVDIEIGMAIVLFWRKYTKDISGKQGLCIWWRQ